MAVALGIASVLHATAQTASTTPAGLAAPSKEAPVSPPPDGIAPEAPSDLPPKVTKRSKAQKNFDVRSKNANRTEDQTDEDVTSETVNDVFTFTGAEDQFMRLDGGPWSAGSGESAALVVRTSTNPKDEGIEEDLQVMHRILEKAIGRHSEGNAHGQAMGIQLFALGGSRGPRSFYIEGYGPIFLLDTPMPLLQPAEKMDKVKTKESDSTWEETKEELHNDDQPFRKSSKRRFNEEPREPYDAGKVEELKDAILKALPNASNIRGFDDARMVVVVSNRGRNASKVSVISGPGAGASAGAGGASYGKGGNSFARVDVVRANPGKVRGADTPEKSEGKMSIAVKKSDIEEFAKKKIEFEEFKKRATITIY